VLQLLEPREPDACRNAREPFPHEHDIRADTVLGDHVGQPPFVHVETLSVAFQPHPAMKHQAGECVARGIRERRRGVEHAPYLRRVDAKQPYAAERGDVDRVAVEDGANEHELGSVARRRSEHCRHCNDRGHGSGQELHRDLLSQRITGAVMHGCKSATGARHKSALTF